MPVTSSAAGAGFIETKQYRRFREFCDACRRDQYIGLCHGPPGVGKTLSARHYANWETLERYRPDAPDGPVTLDQVKGSAVVFYTPPVVVTSPGRLPNDIERLRGLLRGFFLDEIRREGQPGLDAAQERLNALYEPLRRGLNMYAEPPDEVARRQDAWRTLHDAMNERLRAQPDPTALILIDEADRLKGRWWPAHAPLPDGGIADEESIAAIIRITGGNFRLLHRLLTQIGRILEINTLGQVTPPVVDAARESLVIGTA